MKEKLLVFLHTLTIYDFIYFGMVFVLFVILILLTLYTRKKLSISLFILLLSLLEISLAPTIGYKYFHNFLYSKQIKLTKVKKLHFVKAVLVEGNIKNTSKFDFSKCDISIKVIKDTHNKYKNFILQFKPIKTKIITLKDIKKNADVNFKVLIEPFNYKKDFNISISGACK